MGARSQGKSTTRKDSSPRADAERSNDTVASPDPGNHVAEHDDEHDDSRDDEPLDDDLLEGFDPDDDPTDGAINERLGAHIPGSRAKDERWYELVDQQIRALPQSEGKDRRTMDDVFDKRTMMTLYKFLSNEILSSVDYSISTGKEANVFHATTPEGSAVCVKIFRTNNASFHDVLQYIQGDPRFVGIKKEKRGLVRAWAQKEYRNLGRAIDHGVHVPAPISCLDNVLLMEYIGTDEGPAPRLKDAIVDDAEATVEAILDDYHLMLTKAKLVHADLSEFNILQTAEGPVVIDVGQAVLLEHPMAGEFFERDVRNMARFMTKMGAPRTADEVRRHVLGADKVHFEDLL